MDIEQMKQVIDAVKELGGDAKEAFIWYLVISYLPAYVIGLIWTVIGGFGIRCVYLLLHGLLGANKLLSAAGAEYWFDTDKINRACETLYEAKRNKKPKEVA